MALDLGDVGFGLVANTASLKKSLVELRAFGEQLNKVAASGDEGSARLAAAFSRQEQAIARTFDKIASLQAKVKEVGASSASVTAATRPFTQFTATLTKGAVQSHEFARAQTFMTARIGEAARKLREQEIAIGLATAKQLALAQASEKVANANAAIRRAGGPADLITQNNAAYRQLETSLSGATLRMRDLKIAKQQFTGALGQSNRSLLSFKASMQGAQTSTQQMAFAFKELSRATILMFGPLSGVGARMAVLSALFSSTSAKMALFVAGSAGIAAGMGMAAAAGVRAAMQMETFNALLSTATGSSYTTGQAYEYVTNVANKMGQDVQALVPAYAKFTAAARLSGMELDASNKVFEATITAGTALRWNNEQVGRGFLALEQMISKGTVTTEELKRQFGDLLPGAMQIGARAMNVTQAEFQKMLKDGQVMTEDFLPKFAALMEKLFQTGAIEGAKSMRGELGRLATQQFEVAKAFDESVRASDVFRAAVSKAADILKYLADNMQQVIRWTAALTAALLSLFLPSILNGLRVMVGAFAALGTRILTATMAMTGFTSAVAASSAVIAAHPIGRLLMLLAQLGIALGLGKLAYDTFDKSMKGASEGTEDYVKNIREWIELHREMGQTSLSTTRQVLQDVAKRIEAAQLELAAVDTVIEEMKKRQQTGSVLDRIMFGVMNPGAKAPFQGAEQTDAMARQQAIRDRITELQGLMPDIAELPGTGLGGSSAAEKKAIKATNLFKKQIEEEKALLKDRMEMLRWHYDEDMMSMQDYYTRRVEVTQESNDRIREYQQKHLEDLQYQLKNTNSEKVELIQQLQDKIEAHMIEMAQTEREVAREGSKSWMEHQKAIREFEKSVDDIRAKLLELQGETAQASAMGFDNQYRQMRRQLETEGRTADIGALNRLRELTVGRAQLNDFEQRAGMIREAASAQEARIDISRKAGAISELEYMAQISDSRRRQVQDLQNVLNSMQAVAEATGDPRMLQDVDNFRVRLEELASTANLLEDKFKSIFETGFGNFINDVVSGTKSIKEAFRDMVADIVNQINKLAAQDLANKMFGGGSKTEGGGGFLNTAVSWFANLWGGGSSGGFYPFGGSGFDIGNVSARGNIFSSGNLVPFAMGGVVGSPTLFPFSGGTGLMAEAGPEAIMPLKRGADGKLGVASNGGGIVIHNSFVVQGSTDKRSQQQIAAEVGVAVERAMRRNR